MAQQQITNEQEFDLSIAFQTAAGSPATVTGTPAWSASDPNIITLTVAADGLSAVVASGNVGTATIAVTATTASGATVSGTFDVAVVVAEAAVVVFTAGAPRLKTPPPPPPAP